VLFRSGVTERAIYKRLKDMRSRDKIPVAAQNNQEQDNIVYNNNTNTDEIDEPTEEITT
jgi:hypothetical protein